MEASPQPLDYQAPPPEKSRPGDEAAYILPMAVFLAFTFAAGHWPAFFPWSYILKTLAAGVLLIVLRKHYTKISWNYAWLGVIVGIIGIVQWVGMEKLLLHFWPTYPRPSADVFNPYTDISSPALLWAFLPFRLLGPVIVVPFMEELFWRDFLWRTVAAPNDFKIFSIGGWDRLSFIIVTLAFASVHIQWLTAIVWGAMIALLLLRTRSLGACIIAHGVTNLLLGIYVLCTHDWAFW
jgi:CAAX prenyl protease-like protein